MLYFPLSLLVEGREAECTVPNPPGYFDLSGHIVPGWFHLRMLAVHPPAHSTCSFVDGKIIRLLCWTGLQYPQRTLGGRRPSHKNSGLNFKGNFLPTLHVHLGAGRSVVLNWADVVESPLHPLEGVDGSFRKNVELYPVLHKINKGS